MAISSYLKRLREKVGHTLLQMPGVDMVIRDPNGRILLARHAGNDLWAVPGGAIDPHETAAEAAVREAFEETGLVVEPVRVLGVYAGPEYHLVYPNGDEVSATAIVFECRIKSGQLKVDGQEVLELRYFSAQELQHLAQPSWLRIELNDILQDLQGTCFQPATWLPPEGGVQHSGVSDYIGTLRQVVGTELLMMPTASGIVFDDEDRLLLQRRSDTGKWSIPGGCIDPHERPASAVVREVWEETGVLVKPTRVAGIYGGAEFYGSYPHGDQIAVSNIVFICRVIDDTIRLENDETLDARFFAVDDIPWGQLSPRWLRRLRNSLVARDFAHFDWPTASS